MQVAQAEASLLTCTIRLSSVSTWTSTKDQAQYMWLRCHLAVSGTVCQVGTPVSTRPAKAAACSKFLLEMSMS